MPDWLRLLARMPSRWWWHCEQRGARRVAASRSYITWMHIGLSQRPESWHQENGVLPLSSHEGVYEAMSWKTTSCLEVSSVPLTVQIGAPLRAKYRGLFPRWCSYIAIDAAKLSFRNLVKAHCGRWILSQLHLGCCSDQGK